MALPSPTLGLVICYSFLWSEEQSRGQREGSKDRPCAIILVTTTSSGEDRVSVVPITHSPPRAGQATVELTPHECAMAGLDGAPHWVMVDEINRFSWPGYDLRRIPGSKRYDYGRLPASAFGRIVREVLRLDADRKAARKGPNPPVMRD